MKIPKFKKHRCPKCKKFVLAEDFYLDKDGNVNDDPSYIESLVIQCPSCNFGFELRAKE